MLIILMMVLMLFYLKYDSKLQSMKIIIKLERFAWRRLPEKLTF